MFSRLLHKLFLSTVIFFSACSFFQMNALKIEAVSPSKLITDYITDFEITLSFSASCNTMVTESAFSLLKNGTPMEGVFNWDDNSKNLSFKPFLPFSQNSVYEVIVDTSAEDTYGNSLNEEFHHEFSMRTDEKMPVVVSCNPEKYFITDDLMQAIIIEFSKPISPKSWLQSFSISPSANGVHSWNEEKTTFTFNPTESLEKQTTYSITIDSGCSDLFDITIGKKYLSQFSTNTDKTPPKLVKITDKKTETKTLSFTNPDNNQIINTGWECDDNIKISFSKAVKTENIHSFISFVPSLSFDLEDQTTKYQKDITLIFSSRPAWNQVYEITVEKGFEDSAANFAEEDYISYLKTDGSNTKPPIFFFENGISFLNNPAGTTQTDVSILSPDSTFPLTNYPVSTSEITYFDFKVEFANVENADLEPDRLIQCFLENISLSATNGSIQFSILGARLSPPSGLTADGFTDNISPVFTLSPEQRVIRLYVELTKNISAGIISIELNSSFHDNAENPITSGYSVDYIKN